uniref:Signal recognition particle 9 kDa protein n=1 Tax=Panagrolaimus sp. PS1159 TaxID=55785 RepID=A0AC35F8D2_9BILA
MPYCSTFSDFEAAAKLLWSMSSSDSSSSSTPRLLFNYRPSGKIDFKVTNDVSCFLFSTDQQSDLKNFEKLNIELMQMSCK